MAQSFRTRALLAGSITLAGFPSLHTAAQAQTRAQIQRIETLVGQQWDDYRAARRLAQNAHYVGDCRTRDEALDRAERIINRQMENDRRYASGPFDPQEYQPLFDEVARIRARPCPEPAPVYAEDTGVVQSPPAETPSSPDERRARIVSDQQTNIQLLESTLADMERAWRAGDCAQMHQFAATFVLFEMNDSGYTPPQVVAELYRRYNEIQSRPCPPVLPPRIEGRIGFFTFGADTKVETGTGVLIDPGNERFALVSDDDAHGEGGEFRIIFNGSPADSVSFGGRIGRAEASGAVSVAPGTTPVGSVYHDRASNGSTGIALGATGLDAVLARDSEYDWFGAAYERRLRRGGDRPQIKLRVVIDYERISNDFDLSLRSPTFPTISMDARQEARQTNLGIGTGIMVTSPPAARGLVWEMSVGARAYRADSNLDSTQHNVCGLCGAAERDFTIIITDEDKRWGFSGEVGASLGYRFRGGFEIGVQGRADYSSEIAGVGNPETGDDLSLRNLTSRLFFDDSIRWQVGAYLGFRF